MTPIPHVQQPRRALLQMSSMARAVFAPSRRSSPLESLAAAASRGQCHNPGWPQSGGSAMLNCPGMAGDSRVNDNRLQQRACPLTGECQGRMNKREIPAALAGEGHELDHFQLEAGHRLVGYRSAHQLHAAHTDIAQDLCADAQGPLWETRRT